MYYKIPNRFVSVPLIFLKLTKLNGETPTISYNRHTITYIFSWGAITFDLTK